MGLRYHNLASHNQKQERSGPRVSFCGCCQGGCACEDHAADGQACECDFHKAEWGCSPASGVH